MTQLDLPAMPAVSPDAVYPALEKPATELEQLLVDYLEMPDDDARQREAWYKVLDHAKARRLIP